MCPGTRQQPMRNSTYPRHPYHPRHVTQSAPSVGTMYTIPTFRDQDFYCSFTHLPDSAINAEELPYTIHSPYSIAKLRTIPMHRRTPSGLRPDSLDSLNTTNSQRSFRTVLSWTSSSRKRKLVTKVKQLFRHRNEGSPATLEVLRNVSQKPSTLDFRCIGTESRLSLGIFVSPVYETTKSRPWEETEGQFGRPPRISVDLPDDVFGEGFIDSICAY
ncbi:hypothetical protein BZA77DRAFT_68600 [Pyronema omphalodes]|nr:hypothetical protein BZA77DRAFT_68600 [Pyronema omphalodes]